MTWPTIKGVLNFFNSSVKPDYLFAEYSSFGGQYLILSISAYQFLFNSSTCIGSIGFVMSLHLQKMVASYYELIDKDKANYLRTNYSKLTVFSDTFDKTAGQFLDAVSNDINKRVLRR